jgi:hypothetical protein
MKSSWSCLHLLLLTFLAPAVALGDVLGFSPDESFPSMRFDNLVDYPELDFYLLYG